jgi:hypothetical protein
MTIKTFKGKIANDTQDTIVLHTNDGSIGYRIVKFEIMNEKPSSQDYEQVYKIYKVTQTTNTNEIDLSDNTLLGVAFDNGQGGTPGRFYESIIFDSEIFNQDIYVTMIAATGGGTTNGNYYIELEQVKLDLNENTVATLKDIRNVTAPT